MSYRNELNEIIQFGVRWAREIGKLSPASLERLKALPTQFRRTSRAPLGEGAEAYVYPAYHPQYGHIVTKVHKDAQTARMPSRFGTTRQYKERWEKAQAEGVKGLAMPIGYHKKGIHQPYLVNIKTTNTGKAKSEILFRRTPFNPTFQWQPKNKNIFDVGVLKPILARLAPERKYHNLMINPKTNKMEIADFIYKPDTIAYQYGKNKKREWLMDKGKLSRLERALKKAERWRGKKSKKNVIEGLNLVKGLW